MSMLFSIDRFFRTSFVLLFIAFGLIACKDQKTAEEETGVAYSFFVAGHVVGTPTPGDTGLYPPFITVLESLAEDQAVEFGVLTGDVVKEGKPMEWKKVMHQLAAFHKPIYIAPGNHDYYYPENFLQYAGPDFQAFPFEEDLFIILNPNPAHWNIEGRQLEFLKATLRERAKNADHIFVFFHQMLWWEPDNTFRHTPPNSTFNRDQEINFQAEVLPLLKACPQPVYCFSGDLGAKFNHLNYSFFQEDNVTFIASGMGNGLDDHVLQVTVMKNGEIDLKPIGLGEKAGQESLFKYYRYPDTIGTKIETIVTTGFEPGAIHPDLNGIKESLSSELVRSGEMAFKLSKEHPYGCSWKINSAQPGDCYRLRVWSLGAKEGSGLIVTTEPKKDLYLNWHRNIKTDPVGWQQQEVIFCIPERLSGKEINLYLFHPDVEPAYFDDFSLEKLVEKP